AESRRWGADVHEASRAQLAGGLGYYRAAGAEFALWCPEDVYIEEPVWLVRGYLDACRLHGAVVLENEAGTGIPVSGGRASGGETGPRSIAAPGGGGAGGGRGRGGGGARPAAPALRAG